MKKIAILILLFSFSMVSHATPKTLKCSNGFVKVNDLKFAVLKKCGEPIQVDVISGDNDFKTERLTFKVNRVFYSFLFYAGKLKEIERIK